MKIVKELTDTELIPGMLTVEYVPCDRPEDVRFAHFEGTNIRSLLKYFDGKLHDVKRITYSGRRTNKLLPVLIWEDGHIIKEGHLTVPERDGTHTIAGHAIK